MSDKKRILTGDNATGQLHVGHYVGSLKDRVALQDEYETFIIIADMHSLAYPKYVSEPKLVADSVLQVTMDNLAVGLDPEKGTFFMESAVPEIYELATIFSMLVSHNRVLRNPTIKEEIKVKDMGDNYSMGFLNFPILQVADILCVKAELVPVGEDQLPHIELTKEVARKFNKTYGEVFKEPAAKIGEVRRLPGIDGNTKMSKSLDNTIYLGEKSEDLKRKIMSMFTDPNRVHATDPGKVEGNPVFIYHDAFNPDKEEVADLKKRYLEGKVGDVEVKEKLYAALESFIAPIREKRSSFEKDPENVKQIITEGNAKVRKIAKATLEEVKDVMNLSGF
jgi:tryptophanyl-tRNA synthetase